MLPYSFFNSALAYDSFLSTFGSVGDRDRWDLNKSQINLTGEQLKLVQSFTRQTNLLVLAGAWCPDCSTQCAALLKLAEVSNLLQIRFLDRDQHPTAQQELQINGGNRVPVVVFYSEDGFEVGRYGDRVLATYRLLGQGANPHDLDLENADYAQAIVSDWLRELERVQWVLRLSPRLRRLHQD
jgi:hypothetical protein